MGMCACLCLSMHVCSGRGDIAYVCGSECYEWVCVCLCPSVHYEVVGVINICVCKRVSGVCVLVCVHACANGRGRNAACERMSVWSVCACACYCG